MDEAVAATDPAQQDALDAVIQKAQEVNVCITADATTFSNPASLRLLHFVSANWEDITRSVDSATQTVCGVTTSISPFVVVEPVSSVDTTPPVLSNVPAPTAPSRRPALTARWSPTPCPPPPTAWMARCPSPARRLRARPSVSAQPGSPARRPTPPATPPAPPST